MSEQRNWKQKCKEKAEENDIHIIAIEERIRLLQEEVFKDDHNVESSSYRRSTPRKTGKTRDDVDCDVIYRTLNSACDGQNNRFVNIKVSKFSLWSKIMVC